jgi:REP element-mobilizing transposase RayT
MARLPRVVLAEIAHHVTQRGNARRFILDCDADRNVYLELLREDIQRCNVTLLGYCLMSNHVHLVLVPGKADGLAKALKHTHGRYALLERGPPFHRTPLAGTLLLLPTRSSTPVANITLHGAEPCTFRTGGRRRILAVVECHGAFGTGGGRRFTRHRMMATPSVCFQLACLPRSRRNPVRSGSNSSLHLHRPSPGY